MLRKLADAELRIEADRLQAELTDVRRRYNAKLEQCRDLEGEIEELIKSSAEEVGDLAGDLAESRSGQDALLKEMARLTAEYDQSERDWEKERERLQWEISGLENQIAVRDQCIEEQSEALERNIERSRKEKLLERFERQLIQSGQGSTHHAATTSQPIPVPGQHGVGQPQ